MAPRSLSLSLARAHAPPLTRRPDVDAQVLPRGGLLPRARRGGARRLRLRLPGARGLAVARGGRAAARRGRGCKLRGRGQRRRRGARRRRVRREKKRDARAVRVDAQAVDRDCRRRGRGRRRRGRVARGADAEAEADAEAAEGREVARARQFRLGTRSVVHKHAARRRRDGQVAPAAAKVPAGARVEQNGRVAARANA